MATLQKFKLLATQCAIAPCPSQSPNTSPAFQIRRRTTLKKLLTRSGSRRLPRRARGAESSGTDCQKIGPDPTEKKALLSHTLKDLFVSSPPLDERERRRDCTESREEERRLEFDGNLASRRSGIGTGRGRGVSGAFRYRVLRRAWRPVLIPIPE